jgi:hypothetical protein
MSKLAGKVAIVTASPCQWIGMRRIMDDSSAKSVASLHPASLAVAVPETTVWWTKVRSDGSPLLGSQDAG